MVELDRAELGNTVYSEEKTSGRPNVIDRNSSAQLGRSNLTRSRSPGGRTAGAREGFDGSTYSYVAPIRTLHD